MAIQVAHYRLHGKFAATYESGSTRHFAEGRTETIRPCSDASCALVRRMCEDPAWRDSAGEIQELLRSAVDVHSATLKRVFAGGGYDRHLLGLKLAAQELGLQDVPLLSGRAMTVNDHIILSTSSVPCEQGYLAFGPVTEVGRGTGGWWRGMYSAARRPTTGGRIVPCCARLTRVNARCTKRRPATAGRLRGVLLHQPQ